MLGSEKEFDITEAQTHGPGCSIPMFKSRLSRHPTRWTPHLVFHISNTSNSHNQLLSDFVSTEMPIDPLYYNQTTPNSIWPSRMYQSFGGITWPSACTAMCTLTDVDCNLVAYDPVGLTCYLGNFATASAVFVPPTTATTEIVYTRISKISKSLASPHPWLNDFWKVFIIIEDLFQG